MIRTHFPADYLYLVRHRYLSQQITYADRHLPSQYTLRIPAHPDHRFRRMPITHSG